MRQQESKIGGVRGVSRCRWYRGYSGLSKPERPERTIHRDGYQSVQNKERNGGLAPVMQAQASMLSDDDIANLAAYFASLK